jgi:hypothetical protein
VGVVSRIQQLETMMLSATFIETLLFQTTNASKSLTNLERIRIVSSAWKVMLAVKSWLQTIDARYPFVDLDGAPVQQLSTLRLAKHNSVAERPNHLELSNSSQTNILAP